MIAALQNKRNCICLEKNPLLFINSKIHVISAMAGKEQEAIAETEQGDTN